MEQRLNTGRELALILDVDKTVWMGNSSDQLAKALLEEGHPLRNGFYDDRMKHHETVKDGQVKFDQYSENLNGVWGSGLQGLSYEVVSSVAENLVHSTFEDMIHPNILQVMQILTEHETPYTPFLASVAISEMVKPIGKMLGVAEENIYSTEFEVVNGLYTGRCLTDIHNVGGKGKLMDRIFSNIRYVPNNSIAMGDSMSDIPMLEYVVQSGGFAVAVNPKKELAERASLETPKNNWYIAENGNLTRVVLSILETQTL